jgi:imidazole glycerol-phosphate synthase subunit HisF
MAMLTKRIIPCLDVRDGKTVKGIHFEEMREVGDPVELGKFYAANGADELVFLDITATNEKRTAFTELITRIAHEIDIPFTVGGGISSLKDVSAYLDAGADKISVNSAVLRNPDLLNELAANFGSQCIVAAIDVKRAGDSWMVFSNGGREQTGRNVLEWAKEAEDRGAGEILLTSMDRDGSRDGFDVSISKMISSSVSIPVIASGGAGTVDHFYEIFSEGQVDAALAASIFHYKEITIKDLKKYLIEQGIEIRP